MSWTYLVFRWPDEAAFSTALADEGWYEGAPPEVALSVVGELHDAGGELLPGWHVSAAFRERAAPEAWSAWVIDPPPQMPVLGQAPPAPRTLSVLAFRDRLTPDEELAITAAAIASPAVRVWLDRLAGAQEVNLDDPRTLAGINSMASAGLLSPGRVSQILA